MYTPSLAMTTFFTPHIFLSTITYIYNFIAHVYYYSHTTDPKQHPYLSLNENIYAYRSPRTPVVQLAAVLILPIVFGINGIWCAAGTLLAISPYSLYFEAPHNCMQPVHPRPSCSAATDTTPVSFRHFALP